jgi:hypothetical protein
MLMFVEYFCAMQFFGYAITPLQTFLIFSFVGAAYLFPIPLAIGVLEAAQISVFSVIGINPAAGVGLAMIIRFKDVIWSCIGFSLLFIYSISFKEVVKESMQESSLIEEIDEIEPYREDSHHQAHPHEPPPMQHAPIPSQALKKKTDSQTKSVRKTAKSGSKKYT